KLSTQQVPPTAHEHGGRAGAGAETRSRVCLQEGVKTENDHINLKVAGQDGSVVQFKIKRHTPLSKLMKAYCERQGLSMRQIRFRFDGQPINETDTPAQVGKPAASTGLGGGGLPYPPCHGGCSCLRATGRPHARYVTFLNDFNQ
ncbi:unnamed protein product, partial [Gulo gulo]